jgi:protein-tyrosine phosphatase
MTVCTGNICRSPMAQIALAEHLAQAGVDAIVDSTGTSDEEWAAPIDARARRVLTRAGYRIPAHRARQVTAEDLAERDLILPMTRGHRRYLERLAERSSLRPAIRLLREFDPAAPAPSHPDIDIDDPWYGGTEDFVRTLAQIEAAAPGVVAWAREVRA